MMNDKVCAIIVTYNIGKEVEAGVASVLPQVNRVVIVDNGSGANTIEILDNIQQRFPKVVILRNKENLGIAAALNRGVKYALENGYDWVLTLDDDSEAEPKMVEKMLQAYHSFGPEKQMKIAVMAPNYTILKGLVYFEGSPRDILTTITSGQLVKTDIFKKIGFYKEDLFIECVDHEFCLRIARAGMKTVLVPAAILKQRMGPKPQLKSFFGKKFVVANHASHRYYYIYRNSIYLYATYWRTAFFWIIKNIFSNKIIFLKILLFEENKWAKIKMVLKGCLDAISGKYGTISV